MRIIETSKNRKDLAKLFIGVGAEIGVERGVFAEHIVRTATKLFCVDPWMVYKGFRDHVTQEDNETFLNQTKERLKKYNCVIIRKFSMDAVKDFADESLDFVYIDANHEYGNVRDDIRVWSKKVKLGGIVSGHDYVEKKGRNYGVIRAVNELNADVTIWKGDLSPSWSYVKR